MIQHILKLIWNKKKSNALMLLEIFLAFIVLFFVLAYMFFNSDKVSQPLGFETEDRWLIFFDDIDGKDSIEIIATMENLKRNLLGEDEIEGVSFMESITPFSDNAWFDGNDDNGFPMNGMVVPTDIAFAELMDLNIVEGRWYNEEDLNANIKPMVVNKNFMEEYYPGKSMIDSTIIFGGERKLIGVVDQYRYIGEFDEPRRLRFDLNHYTENTSSAVIKLKPGVSASYEEELSNLLNSTIGSTGNIFRSLEKRRTEKSSKSWLLLYAILSACGFLCLNVAMGLFGVLWYNINKRRSEIGLRQALGAHGSDITKQFIIEMLVLTGIAIIIGIFFAIQIPLLDVTEYADELFYRAIVYAVFIMLAIVLVCALIPAVQAAKITPATSLHED